MKMISGSKNGNLNLNRRMTKNQKFRSDFLKIQSHVYNMGSKDGNVLSRGVGGTIQKYPRAKQSLDSNTNSL